MKRILISIAAVLLAAAMLAGCVSFKVNARSSDTPAPAAPSPTPAQTPIRLIRGVVEGSVYTNESAGLMFTAPEGWEYATDEEFEEIMGFNVYDGRLTYDMFVYDAVAKINLMVLYEALKTNEMFHEEETYIDSIKEDLKATYNDPEFRDLAKVRVGANTFNVMAMDCSNYGMTQYYYVCRLGDYMLCIMVTTYLGGDVGSLMANFS